MLQQVHGLLVHHVSSFYTRIQHNSAAAAALARSQRVCRALCSYAHQSFAQAARLVWSVVNFMLMPLLSCLVQVLFLRLVRQTRARILKTRQTN
jgi:hypothetical protein